MAEPSAQNTNEQNQQTQQNAWAQTASQQQQLHPMVTGASYMPSPSPTLPIQDRGTQAYPKSKEITVSMGKLSLLSIAFSLTFLGALTFLSGFLLGMWFAGPSTPSVSPYLTDERLLSFLHNQQSLRQNAVTSTQGEQVPQNFTGRVGELAHSTISNTTVPNVPPFLAPLVTATKNAAGQQFEYKIPQKINNQTDQSRPSLSQTKSSTPYQYQRNLPNSYYGTSPMLPLEANSPQVTTLQQRVPSPSTSHEQSISLSQGHLEDYTIQLGVFASKENAYSLVNDLQALNFITDITESKAQDGSHLYYVHSGRYKDYTTALEAASQFAAQNIPGAIIVKVSQENNNAQ